MTIEELKPLMRIPADASKKKVMRTFERIAEVLMNGCVLTKCGSVPNFLDRSEEPIGLPFNQRRSLYRHVRSSDDHSRKARTRPAIRQVVWPLRVEREIGDFSADKLREAIPYS